MFVVIWKSQYQDRKSVIMGKHLDDSNPTLKRRKLSGKSEENESTVAASVSNQEQTSEIFKLPVELLQNIFSHLELRDLAYVAGTCKWMNEVAGQYFVLNFSNVEASYTRLCNSSETLYHFPIGFYLEPLIRFIQNIKMSGCNLQHFVTDYTKFHQLKKIKLCSVDFSKFKIEDIKNSLSQVEYLLIYTSKITENFVASLPNIRRLALRDNKWPHGNEDEWIICHYPTLERFDFQSQDKVSIVRFLELNQHIRKIAVNSTCLWNMDAIKSARVSVDELAINFNDASLLPDDDRIIPNFSKFCGDLNELYEQGFYKRLKLYSKILFHNNVIRGLATLKSIATFNVFNFNTKDEVLPLNELKDLRYRCTSQIIDLNILPKELQHLEVIRFDHAEIDDIVLFLRGSKTLKIMRIDEIIDLKRDCGCFFRDPNKIRVVDKLVKERDTTHNRTRIDKLIDDLSSCRCLTVKKLIPLTRFNEERKKLPGATKVTLYVQEDIYLATKFFIQQTELELISLKCIESFRYNYDFDFY